MADLACIVFRAHYEPFKDHWQRFPGDSLNPQMLLSSFIKTRADMPQSKLHVCLYVPVADLGLPAFRYSPNYVECSALITVGQIMYQGGVCLVYEGMVFSSI